MQELLNSNVDSVRRTDGSIDTWILGPWDGMFALEPAMSRHTPFSESFVCGDIDIDIDKDIWIHVYRLILPSGCFQEQILNVCSINHCLNGLGAPREKAVMSQDHPRPIHWDLTYGYPRLLEANRENMPNVSFIGFL